MHKKRVPHPSRVLCERAGLLEALSCSKLASCAISTSARTSRHFDFLIDLLTALGVRSFFC